MAAIVGAAKAWWAGLNSPQKLWLSCGITAVLSCGLLAGIMVVAMKQAKPIAVSKSSKDTAADSSSDRPTFPAARPTFPAARTTTTTSPTTGSALDADGTRRLLKQRVQQAIRAIQAGTMAIPSTDEAQEALQNYKPVPLKGIDDGIRQAIVLWQGLRGMTFLFAATAVADPTKEDELQGTMVQMCQNTELEKQAEDALSRRDYDDLAGRGAMELMLSSLFSTDSPDEQALISTMFTDPQATASPAIKRAVVVKYKNYKQQWAAMHGATFERLLKAGLPIAVEKILAAGSPAGQRAQTEFRAAVTSPVALKGLTVDLGRGVKLEMVLIPAGEFMMGSPESDETAHAGEKPRHWVRITKPFYLGKYLVTQLQWEAVMGTGNSPSYFKGPKNPVEQVSWDDCREFIEKLNGKVGGGTFSLPTEAQWEYACRAGSTARYCFGDEESGLGEYAWYHGNSDDKTHPVGGKKRNAWGLYDMHGNVWEWCQDLYDGAYYANSPTDDPTGPATGPIRVFRGGSWNYGAGDCRSAHRGGGTPGSRDGDLGFRVARFSAE
jgi:formylglycine-generating enzyme required for sulfatase activity